jgi:hypothetical protein
VHDLEFLVEVGDNAQASLLRAYLEQHGVHVYVQGENHRSMLGMVGAYIALRLMVPSTQVELARQLLDEYEDFEPEEAPDFRGPFRDSGDEDEDDELVPKVDAELIRKIRLAAVLFPVGGGHLRAGAPLRALVLAALVGLGLLKAATGTPLALLAWPAVVALDLLTAPAVARARAGR